MKITMVGRQPAAFWTPSSVLPRFERRSANMNDAVTAALAQGQGGRFGDSSFMTRPIGAWFARAGWLRAASSVGPGVLARPACLPERPAVEWGLTPRGLTPFALFQNDPRVVIQLLAMTSFDYSDAPFAIRDDMAQAHRKFWQKLARPGSWWTGAQRVAIARESRNALGCEYCKARRLALSPYNFAGEHDHDAAIPDAAVDAVHRVITDQGRITKRYVEDNVAAGLSKDAYVELVGLVVAVFSVDEFHRALGLELEALPEPSAGEPDRHRPAMLSEDIGFVPTVPPDGSVGDEADLWPKGRTANVIRALTLVPDALRDWRDLSAAQYLSFQGMRNFVKDEARSINRMQMELVAARVSSVNECFY